MVAIRVMAAILGACALLGPLRPSPALAQEKSAVRAGFALPAAGSARILLVRPWIRAGAQSTGGLFEPNADWTDAARGNIAGALDGALGDLGARVLPGEEPIGDAADRLAAYRALFQTVAEAVITYQFFPGNRLPTKKRRDAPFDWTLGSEIASIPGAADADYILFLETQDAYGSTGRKALQVFAAMGGVAVVSGVHKGFAGLVDARTGDLVWLNADLQMGGDVRTADGAQKRVAQLLAGFPRAGGSQVAGR